MILFITNSGGEKMKINISMSKKDKFNWLIKKLFEQADTNGRQVAIRLGTSPQNLNKKIRTASLKTIEFFDILDMLGYEIEIKKKNNQ